MSPCDQLHPLMARIMQVHVAEEARHISLAHDYLRERVAEPGPVRMCCFKLAFPVVMRVLCDVIMARPRSSPNAGRGVRHAWKSAEAVYM